MADQLTGAIEELGNHGWRALVVKGAKVDGTELVGGETVRECGHVHRKEGVAATCAAWLLRGVLKEGE